MSFTFGGGSGSGPSKPLFGSTSNQTSGITGGLFGAGSTPATSSPFSLSTTSTSQPTASIFGGGATTNTSGTQQPSIFASSSNPGSGTATPLFGGSTGNAPNTFGQKPAATTSGLFSVPTASSSPISFTPKKDESEASAATNAENKPSAGAQGGGLFSNLNQPSKSLFGTPSNNSTTTASASGSTTPAPAKPTFSFASTTPAGPPPVGSNSSQPAGGLFGGTSTSANTGSGLFGAKATTTTSIFGATPSSTSTSSAVNTTSTSAPATVAPKPIFSLPGVSTPASQSTSSAGAPSPLSGLFTNPASSQSPSLGLSTKPTTTQPQATGLFAGLGGGAGASTASQTSAPAANGIQTPLPISTPGIAPSTTSTNTAPSTTAPATTPSLFPPAKPTSTATTQLSSTAATAQPVGSTSVAPSNSIQPGPQTLGASTTGPAPQMARLKNKTMDEIITRWASDLLKYQKEFQDQATKVAAWDRLLVENGEKIQKLYGSTYEAERATTEVERQLATVEGQQAELESWLDRYEADVDEMFTRQVGQGETLQGPDQERERTYKLAEKLTDRLDEMGKNITSMIDAINEASSNLSKNTTTDDPLSHIVRVLNSHLLQLQWIDQNAELLQQKVTAAQKFGESIGTNGLGGQESDAADAFYRSYMGRR